MFRPNGVRFNAPAGSLEFEKRWNPQTGDIITFKHHGYLFATKKPKFPTLHRLRSDLQWNDVIHHWKEQKSILKGFLPLYSHPSDNFFHSSSPDFLLLEISWINSIIKEEQTERILVGCWESKGILFCICAIQWLWSLGFPKMEKIQSCCGGWTSGKVKSPSFCV